MEKINCAGLCLAFALFLVLPQTSVMAGSINLSPTRIQLSASQQSAVLTIHNQHTESTVIQLEASDWHQDDSGDNYQPSQNLIATPTVFSLQPGESQLVRVGLRRPINKNTESAYRLFIQEVPSTSIRNATVQVVLRFSLPVFVAPISEQPLLPLTWQLLEYGDRLLIQAKNPGAKHIQITGFTLYQEATPITVQQQLMHYLLPGQTHQWKVRTTVPVLPNTRLTVDTTTDAGDMQSPLLAAE
ncbi:MAG: molecular chaperone [Porticoccus sp.]|nr:molecular chaperone [Porticoccus sp.]